MNVRHSLATASLHAFCKTFPSYKVKWCHANIKGLLDELKDSYPDGNEVEEKARVLVVIPQKSGGTFRGHRTLWQHVHNCKSGSDWDFHVFLDVCGRVYDFDYAGSPACNMPAYVGDMFREGAKTLMLHGHTPQTYLDFLSDKNTEDEIMNWPSDLSLPLNAYASQRWEECKSQPFLIEGAARFGGIDKPHFKPPWWNDLVK